MSKQIFSTQVEAQTQAKALSQETGRTHTVYPLPFGFQVVAVTKCPDYVPPRIPLPVRVTAPTIAPKIERPVHLARIQLPFVQESKAYLGVEIDGQTRWFGKSVLTGWQITDGQATLELDRKLITKRGLEHLIAA